MKGHRVQLSALGEVVEAKVGIEVVQRLELLLCQRRREECAFNHMSSAMIPTETKFPRTC